MTMDAISARSINFKVLKDPDMNAGDLMLAVSVLSFRLTEISITMQLEKFKEGVDKIAELSAVKNKITAQMAQMTDEQKKAGLYIDENGNLASLKDSSVTSEIEPPDPEKLAKDPITGTWHTKITTADGAVIDISVDYQLGYENGQYYFQITNVKIGDFTYETTPDENGESEFKTEKSASYFGEKIFLDGKKSLSLVINEEIDNLIAMVEENFDDPNSQFYQGNMYLALTENKPNIIDPLTGDVFDKAEAAGYAPESIDAIFTQNGGESSISTVGLNDGYYAFKFEAGGLEFQLDIQWQYDAANNKYIFDVYISLPAYSGAYEISDRPGSKWEGDSAELLHVVKKMDVVVTEGETATQLFERVFKDIVAQVKLMLFKYAEDPIGPHNEHAAFWARLLGSTIKYTAADRNHGDDKVSIYLNDVDPVLLDLLGIDEEYYNGDGSNDLLTDEAIKTISVGIGAGVETLTTENMKGFIEEFGPIATTSDSAVATDGTTARIPNFYQPNLTTSNTYAGNRQAFLEEILGPDIYTNGYAYTASYWELQIIPEITDSITFIGTQNEVVMSKIKRLIETANSYLQMIITDLQKHFQSVNAVANAF